MVGAFNSIRLFRCFYCDFPIEVVGDGSKVSSAMAYVELLRREIAATAGTGLGASVKSAGGLQTLYFGGGTPR